MITDKATLDKLKANFVLHLAQSRRHKQPRLDSWRRVDDALANRKIDFGDSVVHIPLGKADGFLQTWLSKIDNPLTFKYTPGEPADTKKAENMNAIKEKDSNTGRWNWEDLMGKTQAGSYGRTIYFYTARSPGGVYESELSMIDAFRFHIDPRAGGIKKEKARWLGWGNVEFTREELQEGAGIDPNDKATEGQNADLEGVKKSKKSNKNQKEAIYLKENVSQLLTGTGNTTKKSIEDRYVDQRYLSQNEMGKPVEAGDEDVFKFYRWFETINKTRYVILCTEEGLIIQAKKLTDEWESGLWPIWTWAPKTSPTEFWTLSPLENQLYVFLAQEASISQMVENSDKVNKPQRAVNIERVRNLDQVKYRRDSYIEVDGDADIDFAIKDMPVPAITTPIQVYDKLEVIQSTESGVTPAIKGIAEEDKVGIYEGNLQQVGDRFGLLNKSYAEGYYDFAKLHKAGVMEHLTKAMAVKIIGLDGLQVEKITKRDVKVKVDYDILIESSNAEATSNNIDKKNKLTFLSGYKDSGIVNQKVVFEYGASTAGFSDDEIKRLMDTSDYATSTIIADANDILQKLIAKGEADDYEGATTAFLQEMLKQYWAQRSEIDTQKAMAIENYIERHVPIVEANMTRNLLAKLTEQGAVDPSKGGGQNLEKLGATLEDPTAPGPTVDLNNDNGAGAVLQTK